MSAIPTVSRTSFPIPANSGKSSLKNFFATAQPERAGNNGSTVTISQAAQEVLTASAANTSSPSGETDAQLAAIRAKAPMSRTPEDVAYMQTHDARLADILYKTGHNIPLTSAEIDYNQKAMGFMNSFALLSDDEKALYDKAVASGNPDAAAGISMIAFTRTLGHSAGGKEGTTYDPINTAITADNVRQYFSYSIVDPTGRAQSQFDALIRFLESEPTQAKSAHVSPPPAAASGAHEARSHQSQQPQKHADAKRAEERAS